MLFDLRGRGRRRTIQVLYGSLAILMAGGLVLFGVGTGGGGGGLLNAFNPNGGKGVAKSYVSQQTKDAEKRARLDPSNPQVWANLVTAHYQDAGQESDQATGAYNAAGKADLRAAGQAWEQYKKLVKKPDSTVASLMGEAYQSLGEYNQAAQVWQLVADANPKVANYWTYVALNAYAAKNTSLGDLAGAQAMSLTAKTQRPLLSSELSAAKAKATGITTPSATTTAPSATTTAPATTTKSSKAKSAKKKK